MELLANSPSPRSKPLIVAQSPSVVDLHAPTGPFTQSFLMHPVGGGQFTVDELAPVIASLIRARKAYALSTGDLFFYRVLHACAAKLLERTDDAFLPPVEAHMSDWLAAMRFEEAGYRRDDGLTPLRYAAGLAGRVDLTRKLLATPGTDVEAPLASPVDVFEGPKKFTVLMQACKMHDDPDLVRLLLAHGASATAADQGVGCNAMCHACFTGKTRVIDALVEKAAELEAASAGSSKDVPGTPRSSTRSQPSPSTVRRRRSSTA